MDQIFLEAERRAFEPLPDRFGKALGIRSLQPLRMPERRGQPIRHMARYSFRQSYHEMKKRLVFLPVRSAAAKQRLEGSQRGFKFAQAVPSREVRFVGEDYDDFCGEQRVGNFSGELLQRFDVGGIEERKPGVAAELAVQGFGISPARLARV